MVHTVGPVLGGQDTNELVAVTQECHQGVSLAFLDIVCLQAKQYTSGLFSSESPDVFKRDTQLHLQTL